MALAAVRARVLRSLSRSPLAARRCGGSAHLPPGGYGAWQERAARDPAAFWADAARRTLRWDSPFHTAREAAPVGGGARWFLGGRLNVSGKDPAAAHSYPGPQGPPWRRQPFSARSVQVPPMTLGARAFFWGRKRGDWISGGVDGGWCSVLRGVSLSGVVKQSEMRKLRSRSDAVTHRWAEGLQCTADDTFRQEPLLRDPTAAHAVV